MGVFSGFITAIVISSILRGVVSIIMPEGNMKGIVCAGVNVIIFASITTALIQLIINLF